MAYLRGERMAGIDQHIDRPVAKVGHQTFQPPETADPHLSREVFRISGPTGKRGDHLKIQPA